MTHSKSDVSDATVTFFESFHILSHFDDSSDGFVTRDQLTIGAEIEDKNNTRIR